MKAEDVMKALECCTRGRKSNDDRPCLECPYNECNIVGGTSERQTSGTCQGWLMKDALALLREKDAEIERLQKHNTEMARKHYNDGKSDTVRKMQERLKEHLEKPEFPWDSFTVAEEVIDQIAKEMLEVNE